MRKTITIYLFLILFVGMASAQQGCSNIQDLEQALTCLCTTLYSYVSMIAFVMITLSSLVYALGQMFGAETRARANVWATSMLTGAIIGIVLIIIVPAFVAILLGKGNFDPNSCQFK